jgi:SAM-dependent methyltransferase
MSVRSEAFGQGYAPTAVDAFGIWLSSRRIHKAVGSFRGIALADVGCGYHAAFTRSVLPLVASAIVTDVALAPELKGLAKVTAIEGQLPGALGAVADGSVDAVICNNVIEHLWQPVETLAACRRMTRRGGVVFVNVPNWRGKWFLEFSAFRLGLSPADEMNDHKMYYGKRDLWPLLVRAGFRPQEIAVGAHKFTLNTYAVCRV